jgi:glutamate 5-kinase
MSLWDSLFGHVAQPVAQILITRNDMANRTQYVNAQNTLHELLSMGVIPIVNENDTLAVSEIKFGDNDTLSAITAAMVRADYLFLMTDVDCLCDKNPRNHPDALPLPVVSDISSLAADVSTSGSSLGTGGMGTKIVAARLATSAGVATIITRSSRPGNISEIVAHHEAVFDSTPTDADTATAPKHTLFTPSANPIHSHPFWLLHSLLPRGVLYIDSGALTALSNGASLLPAGIIGLHGHFSQHESISLVLLPHQLTTASRTLSPPPSFPPPHENAKNTITSASTDPTHPFPAGEEVGRALVNYSSAEVSKIKGLRSSQIEAVLGYADSQYVCLSENIALFGNEKKGDGDEEMQGKEGELGSFR